MKNLPEKLTWTGIGVLLLASWIAGLFLDVMEIDAVQYALMSRDMVESSDWLHFYDRGQPYLDKPPLVFWSAGIFIKIFGFSNWSYRIGSLLFSVLALYSTYRTGKILKSEEAGRISALILAASQAWFIMNTDVKTDMFLISGIMFACWQIMEFLHSGKNLNWILGFCGIAIAMLGKGPLGLIIPAVALGGHFLLAGRIDHFRRLEWILGIILLAVLLFPMSYGLYTQFDLNPEMMVNGEKGVSGLRFFFWTQSFGRITGESEWQNDAGPFFLLHTFLWAFLPWTISFVAVFLGRIKNLILSLRNRKTASDGLVVTGFLIPFLALSASNFKLPHYIFVVLPFAALMIGNRLSEFNGRLPTFHRWAVFIPALTGFMLVLIAGQVFFSIQFFPIAIIMIVTVLLVGYNWLVSSKFKWLKISAILVISANLALNVSIYPEIIAYQSGSVAARILNKKDIPQEMRYCYIDCPRSLDLYARENLNKFENNRWLKTDLPADTLYVYTNIHGFREISDSKYKKELLRTFDHQHPGRLSLKFLNPNSRQEEVSKRYLIKVFN